jgi:hypothetical protein
LSLGHESNHIAARSSISGSGSRESKRQGHTPFRRNESEQNDGDCPPQGHLSADRARNFVRPLFLILFPVPPSKNRAAHRPSRTAGIAISILSRAASFSCDASHPEAHLDVCRGLAALRGTDPGPETRETELKRSEVVEKKGRKMAGTTGLEPEKDGSNG